MHYARQGIITPENGICRRAREPGPRKSLAPPPPDMVRDGQELGRANPDHHHAGIRAPMRLRGAARSFPTTSTHPESEPMAIGRNFLVKINANIGNSAVASNVAQEVDKMVWATRWGRGHDHGFVHRAQHPRHPRMDHPQTRPCRSGTVPIYQALEKVGRAWPEETDLGNLPRHADRTGRNRALDYFTIHAGVRLAYVPMAAKRVTGIVSRGGSIMAKWLPCPPQGKLPLRAFRRDHRDHEGVRHRPTASATGLRPGSIADANEF